MVASVRIKNGPAKGTVIEVGDKPISMGRDPNCTIQILDKGASRNHAEIFRIGEMCFIRDLESRNGTFVNDTKIDEELLREGDRIQIGATVIIFESGNASSGDSEGEFEFSEENPGNTLELRLEDLSAMNVGEGDGNEARRLRSLYKLGRLLAEAKVESEVIDNVLPFIVEELSADAGYLFTRDSQKGTIVPLGTFAKGDKKAGKISRSIIRRAIQEKRALMTSDAMQDNRFSSRDSIMLKQIHSVICVPLSVSGDLSGVLYVAGDNPASVFSEEELELAAAMADQVGLAIVNLRMRTLQREQLMSTIKVLVRASEMRDPTTQGHSERVAAYALVIGKQLRMSQDQLESLQMAALLHDTGKLIVDGDSMYSIGHQETVNMSKEERTVHATLDIIKDMACYEYIEEAIRYQLERDDGSGPMGTKGTDIPLEARVLAIAKFFDQSVNKVGESGNAERLKDTIVELGRLSGRKFSENVVKALLVTHRNNSLHEAVTLHNKNEDTDSGEDEK